MGQLEQCIVVFLCVESTEYINFRRFPHLTYVVRVLRSAQRSLVEGLREKANYDVFNYMIVMLRGVELREYCTVTLDLIIAAGPHGGCWFDKPNN